MATSFLHIWKSDKIRTQLLSKLDEEVLCALRLTSRECYRDTSPILFKRTHLTFTLSALTRFCVALDITSSISLSQYRTPRKHFYQHWLIQRLVGKSPSYIRPTRPSPLIPNGHDMAPRNLVTSLPRNILQFS